MPLRGIKGLAVIVNPQAHPKAAPDGKGSLANGCPYGGSASVLALTLDGNPGTTLLEKYDATIIC